MRSAMKSKTSFSPVSARSPKPAAAPAARAAAPTAASPTVPAKLFTHEEISARAREIWESRGRPDGQDDAIWYEAERQLRADELNATEDRRFGNSDAILDPDGDPNDDIDRRLDEMASPRTDRSSTSL
jgi:hypothetical protein